MIMEPTKELRKTRHFSLDEMETFAKESAESAINATSREYEKSMDKMLEPRRKQIEKEKQEFFKKFDDRVNSLFNENKKEIAILRTTHDVELQTLEAMEKTVKDFATIHEALKKATNTMTRLTMLLEKQTTKTSKAVV